MTSLPTHPSPNSTTALPGVRYVVVTPVRDEAEFLEHTIRSMVSQTIRPAQWVIVNDGSSDGTAEIIERWAAKHRWIIPVHLENRHDSAVGAAANRGKRARQAKEIEAFYEGVNALGHDDWDFIVKLDGDVGFEADYFHQCFTRFLEDPKLGIGGGEIYNVVDGQLQSERNPQFHVRGATKIYRRACWIAIGGVLPSPGWDTLDEVKANMLGWSTRTFPQLTVAHHRFTGAANGLWRNAVKNGVWSYIAGYHPLYMLARAGKCIFRTPIIIGCLGLLYGYLQGYVMKLERAGDANTIKYLRREQMARLLGQPTIWK